MSLIIDRFEGDFAVCEDDSGNMLQLERSKLPTGAKEGSVLCVEGDIISIDHGATAQRKEKIRKLMNRLWD